jgi:serine/threonine protein kinase
MLCDDNASLKGTTNQTYALLLHQVTMLFKSDKHNACHACTLLQQYMRAGSLRSVLDIPYEWSTYTPATKHQLLLDIAQGMRYLHSQDVFHRDLKR